MQMIQQQHLQQHALVVPAAKALALVVTAAKALAPVLIAKAAAAVMNRLLARNTVVSASYLDGWIGVVGRAPVDT